MALVRLRPPLSDLAGRRDHLVEGGTVGEVLAALEGECPGVAGWILDENGRIRPHVNVFVNKHLGGRETEVAEGDRVHVLPAISGGST